MTTRVRTRGSLSPVLSSVDDYNRSCTSGTELATYPITGGYNGILESMTDVVTPNFHQRSARGEIIINPLTRTSEEHSVAGNYLSSDDGPSCTSPAKTRRRDFNGPRGYYYVHGSDPAKPSAKSLIDATDISSVNAIAATQAWSAASGAQADILQDVAEYRQTVNMLLDPLQKNNSFLNGLLRKKPTKVAKVLNRGVAVYNYGSSMWLQYRYGIRPLVGDIVAVLDELSKDRRPHRVTSRGNASAYRSSVESGVFGGHPNILVGYEYTYSDSYEVRTGMVVDKVVSVAASLGIQGANILALPWELLPYSFVADWFANVGDFLHSLVPLLTAEPKGTWTTVKRVQTVQFINTYATTINGSLYSRVTKSPTNIWHSTYITTTRVPGIAGSSIVLRPQSISGVLSDLRAVDALTLFTQKLNRVFRG